MAVSESTGLTIPEGCWRQPTESESLPEAGPPGFQYVLKGGHDALRTLARTIKPGTVVTVEGGVKWLAKSWQLQRGRGDTATLAIPCCIDAGQTEGQVPEDKPLRETWTIRSVRSDVSALRYCGESPGDNPQREQIEMWLKETDGDLAAAMQYRDADGEVVTLSAPSQALAAKLRRGLESVMRFYPQLTRRRVYAAPPPDILDKLSYIDTPPAPTTSTDYTVKFPKTLANKIDLYQWLKCQDDAEEQTDGTWARIESWMGLLKSDDPGGNDSPWDADLYGASRWTFPYSYTGQNGGGAT